MASGTPGGGSDNGHAVLMYGLTTCGWCKKMREFLEAEKVDFTLVYVDDLKGEERSKAIEELRRWNPAVSFPTVIVDEEETIVGYRPDDVKEALGL
jgi:glutaredoxin